MHESLSRGGRLPRYSVPSAVPSAGSNGLHCKGPSSPPQDLAVRPARWRYTLQLLATFLCCALGLRGLARADVWAYIDDKGVVHFSAEQLDERYALYFSDSAASDAAHAGPLALAPSRLHAYFEISLDYKVVRHLLREAAQTHGIEYTLLQALIATESGFDPQAVSPKGAVGLMQLMPATARSYGLADERHRSVERQLQDPRTNIRIGSLHLRGLLDKFPEQPELALAAYNAGLRKVREAGNQVPPIPETQNYVRTVLSLYAVLKPAADKAQPRAARTDPRLALNASTPKP